MQFQWNLDLQSLLAIAAALLATGASFGLLPRISKDLDAHKRASKKDLDDHKRATRAEFDNLWRQQREDDRSNQRFRERVAARLPGITEADL
jgi:hypothetical protein